jgi:hypothetical protein
MARLHLRHSQHWRHLHAVPPVTRRLSSAVPVLWRVHSRNAPIPSFIPRALFNLKVALPFSP